MEVAYTGAEIWRSLYEGNTQLFSEPILLAATVVHGFKRGSKELGIPTANLDMSELGPTGQNLKTGVYFGWCALQGSVYRAVVSVGWNPHYKNDRKTVEAHLLAGLTDFYGEHIEVLLCGYLRDEHPFNGLDALIDCINNDILISNTFLSDNAGIKRLEDRSAWVVVPSAVVPEAVSVECSAAVV